MHWQSALLGAAAGVAFMGALGLIVRGGVALGDLLLVAPLGLILGWPAIFVAMFVAGILSAGVSVGLLVTRRAGLKSYIPFVPFLVAGAVIALVRDPDLLGKVSGGRLWPSARLVRPPRPVPRRVFRCAGAPRERPIRASWDGASVDRSGILTIPRTRSGLAPVAAAHALAPPAP